MKPLKETVNLPRTDFSIRANLGQIEPNWIAFWDREDIVTHRLNKNSATGKTFVLHDGPPYPNGNIHLGHALNKVLKDIISRSKSMMGYRAEYIPGWDCHGLPIETQVLKELKSQGLSDQVTDVPAFRHLCAEFAKRYVDMQRDDFKRLGIWGRWDTPYLTLNEGYESQVIEAFNRLNDNGLVQRGAKPIHWCMQCETALAEAEIEYADHKSPSVYVAFSFSPDNEVYVVWTTTPWTLPANVAVAAHPDYEYVCVESAGKRYVGAKAIVAKWTLAIGIESYTEIWTKTGKEFEGRPLKHPFGTRNSPVVMAEFVSQDDGTGFVHIAPGHGQDDYAVGQENGLPTVMPVDSKGVFTAEAGQWAGMKVFDANKAIGQFMQSRGTLLKLKFITHSYPHCWRCKHPVIFRATPQWFVVVDKPIKGSEKTLRQLALEQIKATKWIPDWGENRITSMVTNRPDWCISRQRFWGIEIPVVSEKRDILDVWFESGASFMSVLPPLTASMQADLYLEGSDQHRGWFQSSLLIGCGVMGKAPFKAVLTHGFLVDDKGRKMSKSQGNVVAPEQVIRDFGADVLRWWVASSDFKNDLAVSQGILKQCQDSYSKVRNTIRFCMSNLFDWSYAADFVAFEDMNELDQWALTELNTLIEKVTAHYDSYSFHLLTQSVHHFCAVTMSSMYLDMVKDRLYCDGVNSATRRSTQTALYLISDALIRMIAPIAAFTAEEAYLHLPVAIRETSVHLLDFPVVTLDWQRDALVRQFSVMLAIREQVYGALEPLRADKQLKSFLEAVVVLPATLGDLVVPPNFAEWASFLLVSSVTIDPSLTTIRVSVTSDSKCERCWRHLPVNDHKVCERCERAIAECQ